MGRAAVRPFKLQSAFIVGKSEREPRGTLHDCRSLSSDDSELETEGWEEAVNDSPFQTVVLHPQELSRGFNRYIRISFSTRPRKKMEGVGPLLRLAVIRRSRIQSWTMKAATGGLGSMSAPTLSATYGISPHSGP
jgi:hypothetical protein